MHPIQLRTIDDRILDMDELGHAIVAAEGDLALVAERILGNANKESQLLEAISSNPAALASFSSKARALTIIKMISIISALHMNVLEGAHSLKPETAGTLFVKMADAMERLSATTRANDSSGEDSTMDTLLRRLPPRLSAPLRIALSQQEQDEQDSQQQGGIDLTPNLIYQEQEVEAHNEHQD